MSTYTSKTSQSILKAFSSADRERAKTTALNKVRFTAPKEKGIIESVRRALEENDFHLVTEFTYYLREADLSDEEIISIMKNARRIVHDLSRDFATLVEALLSVPWKRSSAEAVAAYTEFIVDIMVAHNTYIHIGIPKLIVHWIPSDVEAAEWLNGCPSERIRGELATVHSILNRILNAVPLAFDYVVEAIAAKFPYFKKPPHVTAGYLHSVLWLMEYKPVFEEVILQLVLQKLLILDVNAPRTELCDDETDDEEMEEEPMFQIDDLPDVMAKPKDGAEHPIGYTLDICLIKLYKFLDDKCRCAPNCSDEDRWAKNRFFKRLINIFDEVLLPTHNTHHVQFCMFYVTSIRQAYVDAFLNALWQKVQNPNVSPVIRHAAVGYMASFLARAKFVSLITIKHYLKELSAWAHKYIDDSDQFNANNSLKAHMVFFSICQAVFYLIAFRVRDLTAQPSDLLFLQALQLSRLAMCHFNPLRYCLAPVATAFAGVTRTHQLAYCHTVLERNARRTLATVYAHDRIMPDETLETFFPFDPYMLKLSNKHIEPLYLIYKVHELDESIEHAAEVVRRKRGDSEMVEEDDFIVTDKRQRLTELSKSQEFDRQFHYGASPGFANT